MQATATHVAIEALVLHTSTLTDWQRGCSQAGNNAIDLYANLTMRPTRSTVRGRRGGQDACQRMVPW